MAGLGFVTVAGNLQDTGILPERKSTGGPPTQAPIPGKRTTESLAYPTGVEQDPTQGHYIIFEIMVQDKGRLSAARIKEEFVNRTANANEQARSTGNALLAGAVANRNIAEANQASLNAAEKNKGAPGLKHASIQMSKASTTALDTVIALYMPPSVQVSYDIGYGSQEIGVLAETGRAALQAFAGKQGNLWDKTKATTDAVGEGAAAGAAQFVMSKAAAQVQGLDAVIAIERGQVITPRMELLFEGVGRRNFSYSFTFIPKSEQEAEVIEKIVRTFKFHMTPRFGEEFTSGAAGVREMTIPDHFNIRYMYKGKENTHLNKISTCALSKMDVDYGAERFTGYAEGRPQTTKISLSFTEFNIMSQGWIDKGH